MKQISVVMPYYDRREVLKETLAGFEALYEDDVEVIVVDDGSNDPPDTTDSRAKVITLPYKSVGYSPVVPINIGVEYASHDLIAISLPEVRHRSTALYSMRAVSTENTYAMSRCYCESMHRWVATPDEEPKPGLQHEKPPGVAFNFCVMLHRRLWEKIGGMTREYRWGSHFDDTDFAHKLVRAQADFVWVDDVTVHTRDHGSKAPFIPGGWNRNHEIFMRRWT